MQLTCNHPTTSSGKCNICSSGINRKGYGDNDENNDVTDEDNVNDDNTPQLQLVTPPEENNFILELRQSRSFKQSNAAFEMTYKVKLAHRTPDLMLNSLLPNLQALFDTLLHHIREEYGEDGVARIYINHPKLESAIIVRPKKIWELSGTEILEVIDEVLYSAGNIPADDELDINIAIIRLLKGSGRKSIRDIEKDTVAK